MSISMKIDKSLGKINPDYLVKAKAAFHKEAASLLPIVIQDTIIKGISPVQGVNRFQKYSQSYIDQIEGRVTFRMIKGKAVPVVTKVVTTTNIRAGKTSKNESKKGANSKITFETKKTSSNKFEMDFKKFNGKLKSPVNLSVSGEMLKSLKATYSSNETTVLFTSPIAKFHNDLGAGKKKVIRPLLPKDGQRFTALIGKKLNDLLRACLGF